MAKNKKSFWAMYVGFAEKIGTWASKIFFQPPQEIEQVVLKPIEKEKTPEKKDHYVYFLVQPYSNMTRSSEKFSKLLTNLTIRGIETKIFLIGNGKDLKIYVGVFSKAQEQFENIFYNIYDEGDKIILSKKTFSYQLNFIDTKSFNLQNDNFSNILNIFDQLGEDETLVFEADIKKSTPAKVIGDAEGELTIKKPQNKISFCLGYFCTNPTFIQPAIENAFGEEKLHISVEKPIFNEFSSSDISNILYIPNGSISSGIDFLNYKRLRFPAILPIVGKDKNVCSVGLVDYKGEDEKFGIKLWDKLKHMYVLGKTGTGKTTLLQHMILDDIKNGLGVGVIDPHGDLVNEILNSIPETRLQDVILIDVTDTDFPIGINLFQHNLYAPKDLVISSIVSSFKKIYGYSRGPRLEDILRRVVISLMSYPGATLLHLPKFLSDKKFRAQVLSYGDEIDNEFWTTQYDNWSDKFREEAINPVTNKIGQFLSSSIMRNIFSQSGNKLSFYDAMNEQKIILINLSKGKIGEDNATAIGSFLITKFQIDAMSRANIAIGERKEFFLYVDEFQNFATESFASIFSELRKYKLGLVVANQYISQIDESMRNAIFGNIGSIITFNLGPNDAPYLASQFKGKLTSDDIISLPNGHFYTKLMIEGVTSDPFSGTSIVENIVQEPKKVEKIYELSRKNYAQSKSQVEEDIKSIQKKSDKNLQYSKKPNIEENISGPVLVRSGSNFRDEDRELKGPNNRENYAQEENLQKIKSLKKTSKKPKTAKKSEQEILQVEESNQEKIYSGVVKLKYNYGLFVVAGELEGLLHKNEILDQNWKENIQIGEKIDVKLIGYKDFNGEKKAVWSQK